jgi:hypothetical protein
MKTNHFLALAAALFLTLTLSAQARTTGTDSLVIRFANQTRMVIYAPDRAGILALSAYDLNKIVHDMGLKLDSLPNGQTAVRVDEQTGERYLKDTVLVVTRNRGNVNVVIRKSGGYRPDTIGGAIRNARNVIRAVRDTIRQQRHRDVMNPFFAIQLGINGFATNSSTTTYSGGPYELRPSGSRYFALAIGQRPELAGNSRVKLSLYYALEGVWNNYMFDNSVIARKGPTQVLFSDAGEPLDKSKLTNFSLQVPVVPRITFYSASGRRAFYIGVGGFVGYRLDSYTKTKNLNGDKNREYSNFYQTDLRYGLVGHVGIRKLNLFVKYELNPMFQPGKGPDIRSYSFGITL